MIRHASLALFVLAMIPACARQSSPVKPDVSGRSASGMPADAPVCVRLDDGSMQAGVAKPSRAGVYDPATPVDPKTLNWKVDGLGCVSNPSDAKDKQSCGKSQEPAPVVDKTLCQQ